MFNYLYNITLFGLNTESNFFKNIYLSFIVVAIFLLNGCGGGDLNSIIDPQLAAKNCVSGQFVTAPGPTLGSEKTMTFSLRLKNTCNVNIRVFYCLNNSSVLPPFTSVRFCALPTTTFITGVDDISIPANLYRDELLDIALPEDPSLRNETSKAIFASGAIMATFSDSFNCYGTFNGHGIDLGGCFKE